MFFDVLTLLGGLCLFMFGMNVMGQSLERAAGSGLQTLLAKFTQNKFAGFFTGLAVTAVIQSSSATTVMVVGFVNSGLMSLRQAINVIMGANVGTTVTAWILSLSGISGSAWYVQMFKPMSFTPILALLGLFLYMVSKSSRKKDIGTILLGFATLMFGMDIMSDAAKSFSGVVSDVFAFFGEGTPLGAFAPVLAVLAGAVFTAVIQSSSASVGILQVLANTPGAGITNAVAFPIIMGQNIGTCVTAVLSSAGANRNGKRSAAVHLAFNVIGTFIVLVLYFAIRSFIPVLAENASTFSIAIMHTIFNVACTAIMLPAAGLLEKIAYRIIPESREEIKKKGPQLDERFLTTPSVALSVCHDATVDMSGAAADGLNAALDLLLEYTPEAAARIREIEDETDRYEDVIGTYLVKLSSRQIGDASSDEAAKYLRVINDFERIADHAVNLLESKEEMVEKSIVLSDDATSEVSVLIGALREIVSLSFTAFSENDLGLAYKVEPLEQVVDNLKEQLRARHIIRLQQGSCSIEAGFVWSDMLTNIERVADHCSNIAACIIDTAQNRLDLHEVVKSMKEDYPEFANLFREYSERYALPAINA